MSPFRRRLYLASGARFASERDVRGPSGFVLIPYVSPTRGRLEMGIGLSAPMAGACRRPNTEYANLAPSHRSRPWPSRSRRPPRPSSMGQHPWPGAGCSPPPPLASGAPLVVDGRLDLHGRLAGRVFAIDLATGNLKCCAIPDGRADRRGTFRYRPRHRWTGRSRRGWPITRSSTPNQSGEHRLPEVDLHFSFHGARVAPSPSGRS